MSALPTVTKRRGPGLATISMACVAAAVLIIAWTLLSADRGPMEALQVQEPLPLIADATDESEEQDADALTATAIPLTLDLFVTRDPFEPVVEEPEPEPEPATDPETGEPVTPTDPTDPTAPTDPSDPSQPGNGTTVLDPPGTAGTCESGVEVVCQGRVLTLTSLTEQHDEAVAVVAVDGREQTLQRGDVFEGNFVLRGVDDGCVAVTYVAEDGSGGIFRLCESVDPLK